MTTELDPLPLIAMASVLLVVLVAAACRVLGEARRERHATEAAARLADTDTTVTVPTPLVRSGLDGSSYVFQCVSCKRRKSVPLGRLAGGLWRPIRCDDCSPAQGRAS